MNPKSYKRIARRLRARPQNRPALCNILINIRSANGSPRWTNYQLKPILTNKGLEREYGIKMAVIEKFGALCFFCYRIAPENGHKTYFQEGKYYSHHPFYDTLPF